MSGDMKDELLPPRACGRCGAIASPGSDTWIVCRGCGAYNLREALIAEDLVPMATVARWHEIVEHRRLERISGGQFAYGDRYNLRIPTRGSVSVIDGFFFLIESGIFQGQGYTALKVAALLPKLDAETARAAAPGLCKVGKIVPQRWGLDLLVQEGFSHLHQLGRERAAHMLVAAARALGGQQFFALGPVRLDGMPAEVIDVLGSEERTVQCTRCGAPAALSLLAGQRATACPYCTAPIVVPPELAQDLAHYQRRLRLQDAMSPLDLERMTAGWADTEGVLACVLCGAPSPHQPGDVDARCLHCGALIVPSAERLEADVAEARAAREVRQQRTDVRRQQRAARIRRSSTRVVLFNLGVGLAAVVGSSIMSLFMFSSSLRSRDLSPGNLALADLGFYGMYALIMLTPVAALVVFLATRIVKAIRERRWPPVWAALTTQLAGVESGGVDKESWLARWWRGGTVRGRRSAAGGGVEFELDALPALIDGSLSQSPPSIRLYLAAKWPPVASVLVATPGVVARRRAMHESGFYTCLRQGGIEVVASPEIARRLSRSPHAAAMIVPVAYEARRICRLLGATPPIAAD